ncbi:hypothetical protein [Serratia sp. DD3]|uniref:hypothetical protein n=1 Tax=Serratia sp. DD3 TaxID=1410619 RepID=UPI0003C4F40B|nr:hypothetical protein [Serratia sp. DD3]KEY56481.1 hypothetical protein SRDD_45260 [Serratia sp. DD3]KEY56701.1 hypothetical protein SRDD_42900 [Serratia sp. DD3]KEY58366.1 hypothetical protein SRDD_26120 [Serratia sp. DD3]KEY59412.1 hypothetical protein SRDD_16950 [Serratia sp. DD3]
MIYLLKMTEQQKKIVDRNESTDNTTSLNNVESLVERRKAISQSKAREKVLLASSKITW